MNWEHFYYDLINTDKRLGISGNVIKISVGKNTKQIKWRTIIIYIEIHDRLLITKKNVIINE